jgi:two-component system C4-dicarboxylate transport response regulator DctD
VNTVLVVDDDNNIRQTLVDILSMEGYATEAFASAVGVSERAGRGDVGLVVTDINMPDVDGLELLEQIRAAERSHAVRVPVIVLTGAGSEAKADEARRKGAFACFPKPFDIVEFVSTVARALAARGDGPPAPPAKAGAEG